MKTSLLFCCALLLCGLAAPSSSVVARQDKPNVVFILYVDVNPSRFEPAKATRAEWEEIWAWRKRMNEAVAGKAQDAALRSRKNKPST
jgi:hypothetical protein